MKNNNNKTKAFVFDFDDTLATTTAKVIVRNIYGKYITSLTPAQYNTYKLGVDEDFDFSEFKNPEFIIDGNPTGLIELAKEVYSEGHDFYILTARSEAASNPIAEFLKRFSIEAKTIYCVGKSNKTNIAKEKQTVLMAIINTHDVTYFYDDDDKNIELANELNCRAKKV